MEFEQKLAKSRDEILEAIKAVNAGFTKSIADNKLELEGKITLFAATTDELRKQIDAGQKMVDEINALIRRPGAMAEDAPMSKTIGQMVSEHAEVKDFAKSWRKGVCTVPVGRIWSPPEQKTLITSATVGSSTPGILTPERVGGLIIDPNQRRPRMRDVIPSFPTSANAIEYVKQNVFTNNVSYQGVDGTAKAESALTFTISYANVTTIAHWIPASRQVLEDWTQLQGYIDYQLMWGLKDKEDYELLTGDGAGTHMTGLRNSATAIAGTYTTANDTAIDKVNNALAELEGSEYEATAVVMHPAKWRAMQKVKEEASGTANTGPYIMGGPRTMGPRSVWDTPVITTTQIPTTHFLVGDFVTAAAIFDRMSATISISTEHDDYFVKNKVAILCEERLALATFRPNALRSGLFTT